MAEMILYDRIKKMAKGGYKVEREAKNGIGYDTMSDQEVTPQINSLIFIQVGLYYIHQGETVHFIS